MIKKQKLDWWDELPEEVKASALRALRQANNGELKSHKEVMAKYKKWQKK